MTRTWEYRGASITTTSEGQFQGIAHDGERFEAPSLAAVKKLIARDQDGKRKFSVPCWVAEVTNLHDRTDSIEIRTGPATYTGYNLVGGHAKLAFVDESEGEIDVDGWDVKLWAFAGDNKKPLAVERLERAVEEYDLARQIFRERLEKLEVFRLPVSVARSNGIHVEAQVAERLGGPAYEEAAQ